jgi:hypothetical protein
MPRRPGAWRPVRLGAAVYNRFVRGAGMRQDLKPDISIGARRP